MDDSNSITFSTLEEGYDFFIADKWRKKYHFKIFTFPAPSGWLSEAIEVGENRPDREPRIFHILSDFETDLEKAELQLKAKIKKGINKRYLTNDIDGSLSIGDDFKLAGRILGDSNVAGSRFENYFEIDGKKITIEEFINLLQPFEGWNIKFQILDTSEDID